MCKFGGGPAICQREEAIFVQSQKCPYHVIFDLDLDHEHILDAGPSGDHGVRVWSRSSHLSGRRSDLRKLVGASARGPAYSWVHCQHVQHYTLGAGAPRLACVRDDILGPGGPLPHTKNEVDRTTRSGDMAKPSADRQTD